MKKRKLGFTLVELLIVIALIGILSVAVLATINPIEQANKARDARVQNDAAEVLGAIERYYASQQYYPWMDEVWGVGAGLGLDELVALNGNMPGFGVCPGATYNGVSTGCDPSDDPLGELISTDELKTSFAGKDSFDEGATTFDNELMLYKAANAGSVYICFIPRAKANRKTTSNLRYLNVVDNIPTELTDASSLEAYDEQSEIDALGWDTQATSLYKCVPE
jgi:prepilin-type N-terminal cleavage/methylation domain-containing protein